MKKSAFTLIELIIVIAIVALLAAIAVPAFQQASRKRTIPNYTPYNQPAATFRTAEATCACPGCSGATK